jgi:hypothetical protein
MVLRSIDWMLSKAGPLFLTTFTSVVTIMMQVLQLQL